MKFDFESLSAEPLFYMLMHSAAFVCVLGAVFFIFGLLFGYATWGRYKRQNRQLLSESESMKDEIAGLKRKIGDQAITPVPAVAMATETIHMPRKEGATAAEAIPAITAETITTSDIRLPAIEETSKNQPPKQRTNVIKAKAKAPKPAAPPPEDPLEVPAVDEVRTPDPPPPAEPATASLSPASDEVPPPARHASTLAAIIATPPAKDEPEAGEEAPAASDGLADTLSASTELSPMTPLPSVEIKLELDPKLGLIYKSQPENKDDLTALRGIAKILEQRLHEIGIYTYAQIAAWDEDRIKEFSARLSFKDRIQREHWVEQARQLAAKQTAAV